jgi:hypothetical protein
MNLPSGAETKVPKEIHSQEESQIPRIGASDAQQSDHPHQHP